VGYFTNVGPKSGPFIWRDVICAAIGVLRSRDDGMPIGMALPVAWGERGVVIWKLIVDGVEVPGRWVVVAREFWPETTKAADPSEVRGPRLGRLVDHPLGNGYPSGGPRGA
jgi:hypothetical protein